MWLVKRLDFSPPGKDSRKDRDGAREGPLRRSSRLKLERSKAKAKEAERKAKLVKLTESAQDKDTGDDDSDTNDRDRTHKPADQEDHEDHDQNDEHTDESDGESHDEDQDDDQEDDEIRKKDTRMSRGRRVYALSVGRCVDIFRSMVRMHSSVFRFPRAAHKKFWSDRKQNNF